MATNNIADVLLKISLETDVSFDVTDKDGNIFTKSKWVTRPSPSYLEFERSGPLRVADIRWVDIDPVIAEKPGRLVPEIKTDMTEVITNRLQREDVYYEMIENKIRISFS